MTAPGPWLSEVAKLAGFLTDVLAVQASLEHARLALDARGLNEPSLQATDGRPEITDSLFFVESSLDGVVGRLEKAIRECVELPFVEPGFDDLEPVERDGLPDALASDDAPAREEDSPCKQP